MKVAILNFEGAVYSSVTGPYDILTKTEMISKVFLKNGKNINFEVDVLNSIEMKKEQRELVSGNKTISGRKQYDLIIIPAMDAANIELVLIRETKLITWVVNQHKNGAEIASICLGAFLFAATGLLDGKKATTHWMGVPLFKKMFPKVNLVDDKVIVDEGRIYSCGAAFSFTSLMIYLIEKYCGTEVALMASKVFMIQVHDAGQNSFAIFELQRSHNDDDIKGVQNFIERNYHSELIVNDLAEKFNMSLRTLMRRFTNATGNTPLEYIQRVRVEAAKRQLEKGRVGVEQVSFKSGYSDYNFFRKIFKRHTGLSPKEYQKRYGSIFSDNTVLN